MYKDIGSHGAPVSKMMQQQQQRPPAMITRKVDYQKNIREEVYEELDASIYKR